jgi:hypothetical protein
LRSFSRAPRIDQGVGKSALEINEFSVPHWRQLQGAAVKAGGSIESEKNLEKQHANQEA